MTIRIPHSVDALVMAVEALIEGRPMPEEWKHPEPAPEAPAVPPPAQIIDEVLLMQAISDLVDKKVADLPKPEQAPSGVTPAELEAFEEKMRVWVNSLATPEVQPTPAGIDPQIAGLVISLKETQDGLLQRVATLENNFAILKQSLGVS